MDLGQVVRTICGALFGVVVFGGFLQMYVRAVRKGDLIFHGGRIQGRPARVLGVIGILGLVSLLYLLPGIWGLVEVSNLPGATFAAGLFGLAALAALATKFSALFWHHRK